MRLEEMGPYFILKKQENKKTKNTKTRLQYYPIPWFATSEHSV